MIIFNKLGSLGRFGNQLFQIATTLAHAAKMKTVAKFNKWEYNYFFENPIADNLLMDNDTEVFGVNHEIVHYPQFHYVPLPEWKNIQLLGFFQSEKYFAEYKDLILHHFTPKLEYTDLDSLPEEHFLKRDNITSVHVRRTDYLIRPDYYNNLSETNYYQDAMAYVLEKKPNAEFVFHSDDIEWCKKTFGSNHYYSEITVHHSEIVELFAMAYCTNHICSNSSYSWWISWLSRIYNDNGIVIAPKNWFGQTAINEGNDTKDLYLPSWIQI